MNNINNDSFEGGISKFNNHFKNNGYTRNGNIRSSKEKTFRAKGVVESVKKINGNKTGQFFYIAHVVIGNIDYDFPVCSNVKQGDVLEILINVIKINK